MRDKVIVLDGVYFGLHRRSNLIDNILGSIHSGHVGARHEASWGRTRINTVTQIDQT